MADKRFNLVFDVDANIGPIKNAVSGLQGALNKINIPDSFKKNLDSTFTKLSSEIENFEAVASKGFTNMADIGKAEKSFGKITDLLSKLRVQTSQLKGIDPNKFLPQENLKKVQELQRSWSKLKEQIEKGTGNSAEITKQTQELEKQRKAADDLQTSYDALKAKNDNLNKSKSTLEKSLADARDRAKEVVNEMTTLEAQKGGKTSAKYKELSGELSALNVTIRTNEQEFAKLTNTIQRNEAQLDGYDTQIQATKGTITDLEGTIKALEASAQQTPEGFDELRQKLADLKGVNIKEIPTDIDEIGQEIASLNIEQLKKLSEDLGIAETAAQGLEDPLHAAADALGDVVQQGSGINQRAHEMEQLANQVKQFFSIGNTVQLFKRSIKSAFDTIKELDAVMTQTAVVTDFTVGDMWAQLPEYTKRANELGVSVKGAYEAATLYYQQGLETNEVIGVSNETLKMAKIAAIDYATATDYMTSALRGFNMEVNEDSARKINDVYSQLAAKTAADTEEISIAMSKTAPLAHNAGMEIETTAALLSQMIETTREAPETLGTAMKTVIARFQELKKDPSLIEPVDGEIIDANKIETALRTIGVSLRDTSGQFRDLDDVFLEISEKWDSLDTNTQRYIATIAAGSRQQSRFIAMMANYSRTTELVAMANNAAGASQEQFEKTLESMQSKLDRLHNAWNEYTMGLANNQIIKTVIDLLTGFLNTINKISTALSGDKGVFKSFFDIAFLIAGLKIAKAAFNGFFGWLVNTGQKTGKESGQQLTKNFALQLRVLDSQTKNAAKNISAGLKEGLKTLNYNDVIKQFDGYTTEVQKKLMAAAPQIGQSFVNDFKASIGYDTLNAEGKADAEAYIKAFQQELNNGEIKNAIQLLQTGAQEIGNVDLTLSQKSINTMLTSLGAMGSKISSVGSAFTQFGSLLSNLGLEGIGNAFSKIGTILVSLGGIVSSLIPLITGGLGAIKAALVPLLPILTPILIAIVAIGAAFAVWKISQLNSLENQMKAAEESTKRAKEAAEEAKNAYDQLLNDKSGYDETQQALKDLTYGTQEWKEALIEANQQVLTLLQTYPELMKYLGKGEYGQLTISEEGWEAAIDAQQKVVTRSQGAVAQSQLQQNRLQKKALDRDLAKNFQYEEYTSDGYTYTTDTDTQQKIKDLVAGDLSDGELDAALQDLADNSRWTKEELESAVQAVIEYNNAIDQNQLEMQNAAKAFLTSALTTEHMDQVGQDVAGNIVNAFSDNLVKTSEAEINSLSQEIKSNQEKRDELASELGVVLGGNTKNQLNQLYAALSGQTLEDVKAMKLSKDQLAEEIAKYQNGENISEKMNDFAESFTNLAKETQKQVNLAMSKGAEYISGMAEEANLDLEDSEIEAIKAVYGSLEEYAAAYAEAVENGKIEIEEAKQPLKDLNIINDDFGTGLNAGAISGLSSHLIDVFETSGTAAASTLASVIQSTLDGMDTEQAAEFATALNGIDWSSTESVENLSERLEQLVKDGAVSEDQIDDLENQIIQLAKAARSVDLEKVAEQIKNLSKIQYNINNDEQDRNFSESDYKALIDAGVASAGDFVYNLATDSWTYIAGSMDQLSSAIGDNTNALLGLDSLKSGVRSSEAAAEVREEYQGIDTSSNTELYKAIQSYMQQAGDDNKLVSQDWLTDNANDIDALLGKWKEILGEAYALEERKTQTAEVEAQGDQIRRQAQPVQENVRGALGGDENASTALLAQAQAAGVAEEEYNDLTAAIREKTGAERDDAIQTLGNITNTYQEAQAWGVDKEQLQALAEQYIKNGVVAQENVDMAYALALANLNLNTGLQTLSDNYDDYIGTLKEALAAEDTSVRNTTDYINALRNTKTAVQQVLNTEAKLSDSFIEAAASSGLLDKALEGSKEALQELYALAGKEFIIDLKLDLDEDSLNEVNKLIDDFTAEDVEFGATLDTTSFGEALADLLIASGATVDDINEAFRQIGWEPDFDYEEMTLQEAQNYGLQGTQQIIVPDGKDAQGNVKYRVDTLESYSSGDAAGDTVIRVPVIRSKSGGTIGNGGATATSLSSAMGAKTTFRGSSSPSVRPTKNYTPSSGGGGGGGGGGSEKEEDPWENPYDWLYNLTQKINAELRIREKLERRYQRLLKTYAGSGAELKKITDEELASLEKRKKLEEQMIELRKKELKEYLAANAALAQYATIDWELEVVRIDYAKINSVTDKEQGEQIEDYIDKLEELIEAIKDAEDEIEDIEDDIIELKERGREQYQDLEDRALDALIGEQQDLIDEQERIYNAINDAASDLTDAISKNIQKIRQDRQNEETETSLAEKERRLAYLRQDTTGSNALEIKKLEEDLDKEKQNYTDTLIDQSLNDLKEQNDAAAEQRNKQIELMQSQLDWQEKTGYWVDEATRIVREGLGPNGVMSENTRLYQLLKDQEGYDTMSNASRDQWKRDLANTIHEAFVYLENVLNGKGGSQASNDRDIMAEMIAQSNKGKDANADMTKLGQLEEERNQKIRDNGLQDTYPETNMVGSYKSGKSSYNSTKDKDTDWMAQIDKEIAKAEPNWSNAFYYAGKRDAKIESETLDPKYASDWTFDIVFDKWYASTKSKKFRTGGLADFTGPAWLDGTKSKPEMVLNARDTENFIQLKDVLAGLRSNLVGANASRGDWYFDIDINVDEIANDYDVDKVAERIKQSIYNETMYRNVNAINFLK